MNTLPSVFYCLNNVLKPGYKRVLKNRKIRSSLWEMFGRNCGSELGIFVFLLTVVSELLLLNYLSWKPSPGRFTLGFSLYTWLKLWCLSSGAVGWLSKYPRGRREYKAGCLREAEGDMEREALGLSKHYGGFQKSSCLLEFLRYTFTLIINSLLLTIETKRKTKMRPDH